MELTTDAVPEQELHTEESSPLLHTRFGFLSGILNLLPPAPYTILTINFAYSAYRVCGYPLELAFVLCSYAGLLALFWCVRELGNLGRNADPEKRERLKVAIWVLATALNLGFAWQVAQIMPLPFAIVVWCLAGFAAAVEFWAVFVYMDRHVDSPEKDSNENFYSGELSPEDKV